MHALNAKNMLRRIIYDTSLMMLSGPMLVVPARANINVQNHAMHFISYNVMTASTPLHSFIQASQCMFCTLDILGAHATHRRHARGGEDAVYIPADVGGHFVPF